MARRGRRKKSTGSCLLPILMVLIIIGAIGSIGKKKEKTTSVPEGSKYDTVAVDSRGETSKAERESSEKDEKEATAVIPEKEENSVSTHIEPDTEVKREQDKENARDTLLRSNIKTKDFIETEAGEQDSLVSTADVESETVASTEAQFELIKRGDSGDSVKEIQTQLVALGFLASAVDGGLDQVQSRQ